MSKNSKHILSTEKAVETAIKLWEAGTAPVIIASALMNDHFSIGKTETIMRWAYLKLKRVGHFTQKKDPLVNPKLEDLIDPEGAV